MTRFEIRRASNFKRVQHRFHKDLSMWTARSTRSQVHFHFYGNQEHLGQFLFSNNFWRRH